MCYLDYKFQFDITSNTKTELTTCKMISFFFSFCFNRTLASYFIDMIFKLWISGDLFFFLVSATMHKLKKCSTSNLVSNPVFCPNCNKTKHNQNTLTNSNHDLWNGLMLFLTDKKKTILFVKNRKEFFNSLHLWDKVQMAGHEKLYQMTILNFAPHSNTQFRESVKSVLFFFLSLPCVPNHLLQGDMEKETVEKPEKTFYRKQAV